MSTYTIRLLSFPKGKIRYAVIRTDSETIRPYYLKGIRSGRPIWYHDLINARPYTWKTAIKYMNELQKEGC